MKLPADEKFSFPVIETERLIFEKDVNCDFDWSFGFVLLQTKQATNELKYFIEFFIQTIFGCANRV